MSVLVPALALALVLALFAVRPLGAQLPTPSASAGPSVGPPALIAGLETRPTPPLEFSRAWLAKVERVRRRRAELAAEGRLYGMAPAAAAEAGAALRGALRVLVIPVHYKDVRPPFSETLLSERLFGASVGDSLSYSDYWREVSGGLLEVQGTVTPWVRLRRPAKHYLSKEQHGWAQFGRMAELRQEALRAVSTIVDFGEFDNDGPDGLPNSGDDDGYVDFVAFLYAGPCRGDVREGAIWPHRGAMEPFATNARTPSGERLMISDYVVLPAVHAGTCTPLHVGVLAHETGHALGLPDLYDYDGSSQGIGVWGLMGTGSHGMPFSPAHLGAWAKEQLGWVRVERLDGDTAGLRIPPVASEKVVYRFDVPGSRGEYLLFENRQRIGSDSHLPGTGLLVWQVDPEQAELGIWNADERHRAVALIEADGRADLAQGRLSDAGDPFPGSTDRTALEVVRGGRPFRLSSIAEMDGDVVADVSIGFAGPAVVAARDVVHVSAVAGDSAIHDTVALSPEGGEVGGFEVRASAPWLSVETTLEALVVRADPGRLAAGIYSDTVIVQPVLPATEEEPVRRLLGRPVGPAGGTGDDRGSVASGGRGESGARGKGSGRGAGSPGSDAGRASERKASAGAGDADDDAGPGAEPVTPAPAATRIVVKLSVAAPGVHEVIARNVPWSWGLAARGGTIFHASYGWDPLGLRPRPRLLAQRDGEAYPATLARPPAEALYAPVAGADGIFVVARAHEQNYLYRVDDDGRASIVAARLGTEPAYGAAALPDGSTLVADWTGRIQRVSPDGAVEPWHEVEQNLYQIAADGQGIVYAAAYSGDVIRMDGRGGMVTIPTGFRRGGLVALAASPAGAVFAAERGGEGRILRLTPGGRRETLLASRGAHFYGLAVDGDFLYALDLRNRHLLRIPLPGVEATLAERRRQASGGVGGQP